MIYILYFKLFHKITMCGRYYDPIIRDWKTCLKGHMPSKKAMILNQVQNCVKIFI